MQINAEDAHVGHVVVGENGGTSEVLGPPEHHNYDGTHLVFIPTEHGALVRQYNATMEVQ